MGGFHMADIGIAIFDHDLPATRDVQMRNLANIARQFVFNFDFHVGMTFCLRRRPK